MSLNQVREEIKKEMSPEKARFLQKYFKTGKGEYGQGDIFRGISVPVCRQIAQKYFLSLNEIRQLLKSKIHEERFIALEALTFIYENSKDVKEQEKIYNFYLNNTSFINNWDLVDTSADHIIGSHLFDKDKSILYKLAKSKNLWERRIAIISTYHFIKNNHFKDTLKIAEILLKDKHDLIHKAVGWMLREAGKKDKSLLIKFLNKHYKSMPRTMLRYAIEKFPEKERKMYLRGEV